jgi:hypothetical protein
MCQNLPWHYVVVMFNHAQYYLQPKSIHLSQQSHLHLLLTRFKQKQNAACGEVGQGYPHCLLQDLQYPNCK